MTKRQKTGLYLVLSPFIAWVTVFILQIIVRFALSSPTTVDTPDNIVVRLINLFSLVVGGIATIGFLPLIIAGIVLLATPAKK